MSVYLETEKFWNCIACVQHFKLLGEIFMKLILLHQVKAVKKWYYVYCVLSSAFLGRTREIFSVYRVLYNSSCSIIEYLS